MTSNSLFAFNIMAYKIFANVHINEKMGFFSTTIVYLSLIITILHELTLIMDGVLYGLTDFQRLCEDFPMIMAFFMVAYEFYNIVVEKKNIEILLNNLEDLIDNYSPKFSMDSYQKTIMGKAVDILDKLSLYNILFGEFCVVCWLIRPLITNSDKLPFGNPWFPFDIQKYYYYLWGMHLYVGVLGGGNTINIHMFYAKIMAVIAEQFDIVTHSFNTIDENMGNEVNVERRIFERVKHCVSYHQKLLKCCDQLQKCINGIMVCQFCFGISLCFAALATFSMSAFSGAFINLINHIVLELSELYIYCWFSSKLTEHAQNVSTGIFYSNWYKRKDKNVNTILRFTIMRCNKPVVIKAANVLPVSIGSYIWILQQSYSFFMVLRTVRSQ